MNRWPENTIAVGRRHTVCVKSDGTVRAVGDHEYGQCDISGWCGQTEKKRVTNE